MSLNSLTLRPRRTTSWCRYSSSSCASTHRRQKLMNLSPPVSVSTWRGNSSSFVKLDLCNGLPTTRVGGIFRTQSNDVTKSNLPTQTPSSTPTNTNGTFLQKVFHETHVFLRFFHEIIFVDLPLFLPRFIAFVATLQLTTEYGFQTVSCEGPSMEPTIIDGSYSCILIERWSHRIFGLEKEDCASEKNNAKKKNPTAAEQSQSEDSWYELLRGLWGQHFASGLQHGDVIILHHPAKEATICKRIIGMPGDIIVRTGDGESGGGGCEETSHRIVPPGHLWIEGDNTRNSLDSRSYGTVPASLVIGKVICRLWPLREYFSLGKDANGTEHCRRVSARLGRGERPAVNETENVNGSYVLYERRKDRSTGPGST